MKVVIDVPNSLYANLKKIANGSNACKRLLECVKAGKPVGNTDNAPTVEEITNEDIHLAINEGFANGYEMAKAKFERPTGEWIYNRPNTQTGANIFRCSICNYETQCFTCGIKNPKFDNYCGNCGADMRIKNELNELGGRG